MRFCIDWTNLRNKTYFRFILATLNPFMREMGRIKVLEYDICSLENFLIHGFETGLCNQDRDT